MIARGLVALFESPKGKGRLRNSPVLSRLAAPDAIVSLGVTRRQASQEVEETFLYTRVYVKRAGKWLILANQIARPSSHSRPDGIGPLSVESELEPRRRGGRHSGSARDSP
jgi:hypothetical protein